jgi:hypothetical protein
MRSGCLSKLVVRIAAVSIVFGSWCGSESLGSVAISAPRNQGAPKLPKSSPQNPTKIDTLIVPGKRVGAITTTTTYSDLVKIFGKNRLTQKKVYGPEGQVEFPGTSIVLGRNRSITVAWKDTKRLQPLQVIINDPAWKTAEGIGLGTSLTKLRQVLGDFKITGLYWDYGNQVVGLSPAIRSRYTGLSISVDADRVAAHRFPKDLKAVIGDGVTLAASNPHWKPLKMRVSGLSVYFPTPRSTKPKK